MDDTAPAYDWKGLIERCHRWGQDWAEWHRGKGVEIAPEQLPAAYAPASEAQIAREEVRLGVRLPPSLRSFFLQSNGHGRATNFIWAVRSVEQIGWMRDAVPFLHEILDEDDPQTARSLVVSGESDASWWVLDPGEVDDRGEWRAGRWSSWTPGITWFDRDFFGLFEKELSSSERLLEREKHPPPPPGTGRSRTELSIGDVNSPLASTGPWARNGYMYVPVEGFTSVVTISAPARARVGEWVHLKATRRSGPWNPVKWEEIGEEEIKIFEPPLFEREVGRSLSWNVDPPGAAIFDTDNVPGRDIDARYVIFSEPGVYKLQARSAFPLPVLSNDITITVA